MAKLLGGFGMGEKQARALGEPQTRKELVEMINKACELDKKAAYHTEQASKKFLNK